MEGKLAVIYFSPTHTSRTTALAVAEGMAELGAEALDIDLTKPEARADFSLELAEGDVAVIGYPVYAGRVPRVLAELLANVKGGGAAAVPVAVYGNRDFDDALVEMADLLDDAGFAVVAAGAFVGEHSFSRLVGTDRPDAADVEAAVAFGAAVAAKLVAGERSAPELRGNRPYTEYRADLPFMPATTDACTDCGVCAHVCPMAAIDPADVRRVDERCISCCACVKACPEAAKTYADTPIDGMARLLQENCAVRREPETFL